MSSRELSNYKEETLIPDIFMRLVYCLLALLIGSPSTFATHIIGGYIRATPLVGQGLAYQITVTMYENTGAAQAANTLDVCFGDNGKTQPVNRTSIRFLPVDQGISPGISISEYTTTYVYSGPGVYSIQATAINRNSNTRNIRGGVPLQQAFSLRTNVQVSATLRNQTPTVALPTTGLVVGLNQRVLLALNATDAEGDSLVYSLALPLTSASPDGTASFCTNFSAVSGYQFPNDVAQKGTYRLNAKTGLLTWDVPTEQGQYAAAMLVSEWRNGAMISQTQHEIAITVVDKGGSPVTPPAYEPAQMALITAVADADGLSLRLSPNPVTGDAVQADLFLDRAEQATLELLDSQGRIYKTVQVSQPSSHHQYVFDLVGKPAGLYLIRAESGGQQVVRKVLKQ